MKRICRYLPFLTLLLLCVPFASAQSSVDFMLGFGTAHDGASSKPLDCTSFGFNCGATSSLDGFFLGIGGDVMLWKHVGIGAEVNVKPVRSTFAGSDIGDVQYRETFYDFNGIYAPVNSKRASLYFEGGVGAARTSLSVSQSGCIGTACTTQNSPLPNSTHFQVHAGVGISLFVTEHVFIRPQFDIHYVPNLTNQPGFRNNLVPEGTVWIGYNFGER